MADGAAQRKDPHGAYRFKFSLEINGLQVAGFTEVSGLSSEIDVETVSEGGAPAEFKIPKGARYSDITLKRGYIDHTLLQWHQKIIDGKIERKQCTIFLNDNLGKPARSWNIKDAFPIKWEGPSFEANSSNVAFETLVLAHKGVTAGT